MTATGLDARRAATPAAVRWPAPEPDEFGDWMLWLRSQPTPLEAERKQNVRERKAAA